jgi:(p)ppGpp synthase/HD superfamily hydrolase
MVRCRGPAAHYAHAAAYAHMPQHKRLAIARETLEIFAPLAHRLGMWQYKEELVRTVMYSDGEE